MFFTPHDFLNLVFEGRPVGVTALDGGTEHDTGVEITAVSKLGVDVETDSCEKVPESTEEERFECGLRRNFR